MPVKEPAAVGSPRAAGRAGNGQRVGRNGQQAGQTTGSRPDKQRTAGRAGAPGWTVTAGNAAGKYVRRLRQDEGWQGWRRRADAQAEQYI